MSKSKSSTRPALQAVPSSVAGAAHAARGDANVRALSGLQDRRRASQGVETAHGLLDLLGQASGTCDPDLVVGLLQEVRHTLSLLGTALATVELIDQPLLEDDDIVNTIAALRRKLVVVERLYTMRVHAVHTDDSGEVAQ